MCGYADCRSHGAPDVQGRRMGSSGVRLLLEWISVHVLQNRSQITSMKAVEPV